MPVTIVVLQLLGVMTSLLKRATRDFEFGYVDVLALAWLKTEPGIPCARLASFLGRPRQAVQRSLERLEGLGLTRRFDATLTGKTVGWGLTDVGLDTWHGVVFALKVQEDLLAHEPVLNLRQLTQQLEIALRTLLGAGNRTSRAAPALVETPPPRATPSWDL